MNRSIETTKPFGLPDLLVLVATLGLLLVIALPVIEASQFAARRIQCSNNLKQYGLGIHNYTDVYKQLPPGGTYSMMRGGDLANRTRPQCGWQVRVLPFMEQNPFYNQLDMRSAAVWDSEVRVGRGTMKAHRVQVPYTMCPSDRGNRMNGGWAQSSYSGCLGSQQVPSRRGACNTWMTPGVHYHAYRGRAPFGTTPDSSQVSGVFNRLGAHIGFQHIRDGTSNTLMVGEILVSCNDHTKGWWHYNGMANAHASTSVPLNTMTTCAKSERECKIRGYFNCRCWEKDNWNYSWGFRSKHEGGVNFTFGDGSVQFLSDDIDYHVYQALGGRDDGEVVDW